LLGRDDRRDGAEDRGKGRRRSIIAVTGAGSCRLKVVSAIAVAAAVAIARLVIVRMVRPRLVVPRMAGQRSI